MGLSISQSAAERERVEQLSLKSMRSANRSESKSQDINKLSNINDERLVLSHELSANQLKLPQPASNMKSELRQSENISFDEQNDMRHSVENAPKIAVIPPSEKKKPYFQNNKQMPTFSEAKQRDTINHDDIIAHPQLHKKEAQEIHIAPKDQKALTLESNTYNEQTPTKIGVQNLTENISPARITRYPEKSQQLQLSSASRTLNMKKALPTLNSDPLTFIEEPHHANLQVEFQNFDWEIPRASKEGSNISPLKKLKPQSSVVLISKFGKEEQEPAQQSGERRKWKTRRELMNEIVNDRLETVDSNFFLPQCLPNGSSGYESIQQICS